MATIEIIIKFVDSGIQTFVRIMIDTVSLRKEDSEPCIGVNNHNIFTLLIVQCIDCDFFDFRLNTEYSST